MLRRRIFWFILFILSFPLLLQYQISKINSYTSAPTTKLWRTIGQEEIQVKQNISGFSVKAIINLTNIAEEGIPTSLLDVDSDGTLEVVVGPVSGLPPALEIIDFDENTYNITTVRTSKNTLKLNGRYYQYISSADIDCDEKNETIIGTYYFSDCYLRIISYNGSYFTKYVVNLTKLYEQYTGSKPEYMETMGSAVSINLDGDPYLEILAPTSNGLMVLDDPHHNFTTIDILFQGKCLLFSPIVTDINADGSVDAVVLLSEPYHNKACIVNIDTGEVLGTFTNTEYDYTSFYLYAIDIDNNGKQELVGVTNAGERSYVLVLANLTTGGFRPIINVSGDGVFNDVFEDPSFVDIDMDGRYEIVDYAITDQRQYVSVFVLDDDFDLMGRLILNDSYGVVQRPAVGDINGDGVPDIVAGGGATVYFIDGRSLSLIWEYNTSMLGSLYVFYDLIGDVDGDGLAEVVVTTDNSVVVFDVCGWGSPWPLYNSGVNNTCRLGDRDGDGLADYLEWYYGADLSCWDSDGDGMPDGWEVWYGLDPACADGRGDLDGDGLSNLEEYWHCTDPLCWDSDGDFVSDGWDLFPAFPDFVFWFVVGLVVVLFWMCGRGFLGCFEVSVDG